jgi:ureidoglycolate dehydrogenase (NAD+)
VRVSANRWVIFRVFHFLIHSEAGQNVGKSNMGKIILSEQILNAFIIALTTKIGLPEREAAVFAESLIDADLKGIHSHGLIRLPIYIRRMEAGLVDVAARTEVVRDDQTVTVLDAKNGLGQAAGVQGMEEALARAGRFGVGICGIFRSNHFGALGYYTELASRNEMIGMVTTNSFPAMAPVGGREKVIGNNPFALSVPRLNQPPITYDVSTSTVALGKILVAKQEGKTIPLGWALDQEGRPTDNPDDVIQRNGSLTPFERHKGYGFAFMLEILAGVLTGAHFGRQIRSLYNVKEFSGLGHFMMALDIRHFMELPGFYERLEHFVEDVKSSNLAAGEKEILIPGEIEHRKKRIGLAEGLAYDESLLVEINSLAGRYSCVLR